MKIGFLFLFLSFFLIACMTPADLQHFEDLCVSHRHMWMRMTPLDDGDVVSKEACWGCMPDMDHHLCSKEDYQTYLDTHDDHDMEGMMHAPALAAHGGEQEYLTVGTYLVTFDKTTFLSGTTQPLVFTIIDDKKPITSLDIMHERPMHVILVRDDLQYFDHLHPTLEGTSWSVPVDFLAPGHYRVWVDFTKDMQQYLVDFDFTVKGDSQPELDHLGDLRVDMDAPGIIAVGQPTPLRFFVTDAVKDEPLPVKETFLGAAAHLIVIDNTLTEFIHDHDMAFDQDHVLSFTPTFLQPGQHRAWVQFSVEGKNRIASFSFSVAKK